MTYSEFKQQRQAKYEELFEKIGLFWAFGNDQFNEAMKKHPLEEGQKYCSVGAGGYFAGQHKQAYIEGMDALKAWEKQAKKDMKESQAETEKAILYELNNHEAFYTGEIDEVVDLFKGIYTIDQIRAVYRANVNKVAL